MTYRYEIEESTKSSIIYADNLLIDHKSNWESVESARNWAELIVNDLNNGINLDAFTPKESD